MQAVGYAYTPIPMCATMPPLTVLGIADSLIRLRLPPGRGHRYNSELESRRTLHENASRHTLSLVGGNVAQFGAPGLRADQPNAHIAPHCADRILVYSIGVDNDAIASGRRIKDLATRGAAELDIVAHSGLGMHALSTAGMLSCTIELHCPPAVVYWSHLSSVVPQHPSMLLGQGLCGLWPCSLLVLRLLLAPGGRVVWWGGGGLLHSTATNKREHNCARFLNTPCAPTSRRQPPCDNEEYGFMRPNKLGTRPPEHRSQPPLMIYRKHSSARKPMLLCRISADPVSAQQRHADPILGILSQMPHVIQAKSDEEQTDGSQKVLSGLYAWDCV